MLEPAPWWLDEVRPGIFRGVPSLDDASRLYAVGQGWSWP